MMLHIGRYLVRVRGDIPLTWLAELGLTGWVEYGQTIFTVRTSDGTSLAAVLEKLTSAGIQVAKIRRVMDPECAGPTGLPLSVDA